MKTQQNATEHVSENAPSTDTAEVKGTAEKGIAEKGIAEKGIAGRSLEREIPSMTRDAKTEAMTEADGSRQGLKRLQWLAQALPSLGLLTAAALVAALFNRLDQWDAWQFVILLYIVFALTATSLLVDRWLTRSGIRGWEGLDLPRALLWTFSGLAALVVFFPPTERLVGFLLRLTTVWRYR